MSRWRGWSRKQRASYLAVALLVLATTGWASNRLTSAADEEASSLIPVFEPVTAAEDLRAPLPPPQTVFLQKRTNADGLGNVFVIVQLSADDLAAKQTEGTRDFVTLGTPENQVILRDDGAGGDPTAGDGLFTGIASVDVGELADKASGESGEVAGRSGQVVPVYQGRTTATATAPQPFDFASFDAGQRVRFDPAVVFLENETQAPSAFSSAASLSTATSKGLTPVTASISTTNPIDTDVNDFQKRVLMIRDPGVVEDPTRTYDPCTDSGAPDGVWTFNRIATGLANQTASGIDPADLAERWLENWTSNRTINADTVAARLQMQSILDQWPRRFDGKLDLARSPLRLLAIVPRVDLRTTTGGGGSYAVNTSGNFLDAGEARFVFGFVLRSDWKSTGFLFDPEIPPLTKDGCRGLPFTVIVEFRVPKCECEGVRDWARQWIALDDDANPPGSPVYNRRLEKLTQQFVKVNANPTRPNGSALGQLRTNEVALAAPWELREFQLTQFPFTFLTETTVGDTPEDAYNNNANNTGLLRNWILTIRGQLPLTNLEAPIRPVPLLFGSSVNFQGGNSLVPEANPNLITFHWNAPNLNLGDTRTNWARHRVSRATCNGCHRRETLTPFLHVSPLTPAPVAISGFLTGISVPDPANAGNPVRNFDDLARRELDIQQVAKLRCFHFRPINTADVEDSLRSTGKLPANLFNGTSPHQHVSVAVEDMKANHISEVH